MKIKASSINNLTDARYFAAWNVAFLGFSLDHSKSTYISPKDVKEIKDWLVGPQFVGEFGLVKDADEILTAVEMLQLEAVQLSHFTSPSILPYNRSFKVIKEWVVQDLNNWEAIESAFEEQESDVDFYFLNFTTNNIDWSMIYQHKVAFDRLCALCQEYAIILSIDCPASELPKLIEKVAPHALSLSGGEEEQVGVKSFEDLDEIYDVLETMDLLY